MYKVGRTFYYPVNSLWVYDSRKFSDNVSLQNKELISACQSGDVMTVMSLLNSRADVHTEDKVQ